MAYIAAFLLCGGTAMSAERTESQRWFEDAKFGVFIHWGAFSVPAKGEWVMKEDGMKIADYEEMAKGFNPVKFNAAEWVSLIKSAGARYITLITKHHDGFCLFDSKLTRYDVIDWAPFGRDVVKELSDECHRQGLKIFFYYSHLDWHHPDYYPLGWTGWENGRQPGGDWKKYVEYYEGQLRELCGNYGKIGGIWFDGWWDKPEADWDLKGAYGIIHGLQPEAMICNNHHVKPFPGEDYQAYERDFPGEDKFGYSATSVISNLPLETCGTLNDSWGYNAGDRNFKPLKEIIWYLVGAACRNANLLLNIGPMPDGEIDGTSRERLRQIGEWMKKNGDSIYGTRGGPYGYAKWGGSTWKDRRVFLHVNRLTGLKNIPGISSKIVSAELSGGGKLDVREGEKGLEINVPLKMADKIDTIIILNTENPGPFLQDEGKRIMITKKNR